MFILKRNKHFMDGVDVSAGTFLHPYDRNTAFQRWLDRKPVEVIRSYGAVVTLEAHDLALDDPSPILDMIRQHDQREIDRTDLAWMIQNAMNEAVRRALERSIEPLAEQIEKKIRQG